MAVKIGNLDISAFKVGSADTKVYLGDTLLYPTAPPSFSGKWLATYTGGTTSSAECDANSAITSGEITLTDLVSVEIGDCATSIARNAFLRCATITSVNIGNGLSTINTYAFFQCTSLTSLTIGSGITEILNNAVRACTNLSNITINATTPPTLGSDVFSDTNNCPIYVPAVSVDVYKSASGWSTYASRIQAIP